MKHSRSISALAALTLTCAGMALPNSAHAGTGCYGNVADLAINSAGGVVVSLTGGNSNIQHAAICSVSGTMGAESITKEACQALYSMLQAAYLSNTQVILYLDWANRFTPPKGALKTTNICNPKDDSGNTLSWFDMSGAPWSFYFGQTFR